MNLVHGFVVVLAGCRLGSLVQAGGYTTTTASATGHAKLFNAHLLVLISIVLQYLVSLVVMVHGTHNPDKQQTIFCSHFLDI